MFLVFKTDLITPYYQNHTTRSRSRRSGKDDWPSLQHDFVRISVSRACACMYVSILVPVSVRSWRQFQMLLRMIVSGCRLLCVDDLKNVSNHRLKIETLFGQEHRIYICNVVIHSISPSNYLIRPHRATCSIGLQHHFRSSHSPGVS